MINFLNNLAMAIIIIAKICLILGVTYEAVVRAFPAVKDYTLVGNIFKWLIKISDLLNNGVK